MPDPTRAFVPTNADDTTANSHSLSMNNTLTNWYVEYNYNKQQYKNYIYIYILNIADVQDIPRLHLSAKEWHQTLTPLEKPTMLFRKNATVTIWLSTARVVFLETVAPFGLLPASVRNKQAWKEGKEICPLEDRASRRVRSYVSK